MMLIKEAIDLTRCSPWYDRMSDSFFGIEYRYGSR